MRYFPASWSRSLWLSSLVMAVLGVVACWLVSSLAPVGPRGVMFYRGIILLIFLGPVFFLVRGYTVTADAVLVHRLGWRTRIPLDGFRDARFQPGAMAQAWRLLGNGGAYAYTGFYKNGAVGLFRAFVTNPARTVVVRTAPRTYVLSPDDPDAFVRLLAAEHTQA